MLDKLDDYNWKQAFGYAGESDTLAGSHNKVGPVVPGLRVSDALFTREDVEEIIFLAEGENDGADWLGVFKLKDGRYAYLSAGCDYTGWD